MQALWGKFTSSAAYALDQAKAAQGFVSHLLLLGHSSLDAVLPPFPTARSFDYAPLRGMNIKPELFNRRQRNCCKLSWGIFLELAGFFSLLSVLSSLHHRAMVRSLTNALRSE